MQVVLYLLGGMGVVALCLATFVFAVSARTYVTGGYPEESAGRNRRDPHYFKKRSGRDRRRRARHDFPFCVNGVWLEEERRSGRDRRLTTHL